MVYRAKLEEFSRAWKTWVDDEDGWYSVPVGEVIALV